eukprot:4823607-Pyramimonas_sp.AAC.1
MLPTTVRQCRAALTLRRRPSRAFRRWPGGEGHEVPRPRQDLLVEAKSFSPPWSRCSSPFRKIGF